MSLMRTNVHTSEGFPVVLKAEDRSEFDGTPPRPVPFGEVAITIFDSERRLTLILGYDSARNLSKALAEWCELDGGQ